MVFLYAFVAYGEFLYEVSCRFYIFRDLDRERAKLEAQEKKIIADIKKMAKQGQMVTLFILINCINNPI